MFLPDVGDHESSRMFVFIICELLCILGKSSAVVSRCIQHGLKFQPVYTYLFYSIHRYLSTYLSILISSSACPNISILFNSYLFPYLSSVDTYFSLFMYLLGQTNFRQAQIYRANCAKVVV